MKFEAGKHYKSKGGWTAEVTRLMGRGFTALHQAPDGMEGELLHRPNGDANSPGFGRLYDLLLPAIDAEGSELSDSTVTALKAYREFWDSFRLRVLRGDVEATDGHAYVAESGGRVACNYATGLDAISDASAVIAAINSLLEGKTLACWCAPGEPCHADVLLEIANSQEVPHD